MCGTRLSSGKVYGGYKNAYCPSQAVQAFHSRFLVETFPETGRKKNDSWTELHINEPCKVVLMDKNNDTGVLVYNNDGIVVLVYNNDHIVVFLYNEQ